MDINLPIDDSLLLPRISRTALNRIRNGRVIQHSRYDFSSVTRMIAYPISVGTAGFILASGMPFSALRWIPITDSSHCEAT
ncbi:hypothetical protein ABIE66_002300 [Peribacillus sp. B2I2]|uniref:hypothetical protein n=1 Tax=Peribacillus sp. B2I2 TaxID=3156468 RepID=UPI003519CA2D